MYRSRVETTHRAERQPANSTATTRPRTSAMSTGGSGAEHHEPHPHRQAGEQHRSPADPALLVPQPFRNLARRLPRQVAGRQRAPCTSSTVLPATPKHPLPPVTRVIGLLHRGRRLSPAEGSLDARCGERCRTVGVHALRVADTPRLRGLDHANVQKGNGRADARHELAMDKDETYEERGRRRWRLPDSALGSVCRVTIVVAVFVGLVAGAMVVAGSPPEGRESCTVPSLPGCPGAEGVRRADGSCLGAVCDIS